MIVMFRKLSGEAVCLLLEESAFCFGSTGLK
jgi:hypothetical protein